MPDYGARVADHGVARSKRKMQKVYDQAAKELERKLRLFRKRFAAKQAAMSKDLAAGKITKAEYDSWMRGQVFIGKRWEAKLNQAINIFQKANRLAHRIIQKIRLWVFSENYNHNAYETEVNTGVSFDIYNEEAVKKLSEDDPKMLPEWRIDEDKDYIWNRQKVENAITQGIIQGESVDQIAQRLADVLKTTNMNKMRMFARTAMTGAQNAGRQKQMEDAEAKGIKLKKRWVASLDNRTRDAHQKLDGQTVPVSESFNVVLKNGHDGHIRYPGDPNADPSNVYNCRCTMIEIFDGIKRKNQRRAYEEPDETGRRRSYIVEDMNYLEWLEWKKRGMR